MLTDRNAQVSSGITTDDINEKAQFRTNKR